MKARIEITINIEWIRQFARLAGVHLDKADEERMCRRITKLSEEHLNELTESPAATFNMARLLIIIYTSNYINKLNF